MTAAHFDAVIAFMRSFIDCEYQALQALYQEPDYEVFRAKADAVDQFFGPELVGTVSRPSNMSAARLAEMREIMLPDLIPRQLFEIRHCVHALHGELFRCVVSGTMRLRKTRYFSALFARQGPAPLSDRSQAWHFVSDYGICGLCGGEGSFQGEPCPDCEPPGWTQGGDLRLAEFSEMSVPIRFEAPTEVRSLRLYELN